MLTNNDKCFRTDSNRWLLGGCEGCVVVKELGGMLKEPTHIQAHLVFADTKPTLKKPKELEISEAIHEHQ